MSSAGKQIHGPQDSPRKTVFGEHCSWAMRRRAQACAVVLLVAVASFLRFDGITLNYPYLTYVDEGYVVQHAMNMFRDGTLNPHWHLYYPGLMNLTNAPIWLYHRLLHSLGDFRETVKVYPVAPYFWLKYGMDSTSINWYYALVDPPVFLLVARVLVALFSSASVWVIYRAFRAGHSWGEAFTGAAFFALIPALVVHSHSVNNNIPMVFFFAVVLWALLRWRDNGSLYWLAAMGLAAGAAAAFKPTGILALGLPLLGVAAARRPWKAKILDACLLCALSVLGFFALCPNFLCDPRAFVEGTLECLRYYKNAQATPSAVGLMLQRDHAGWPFLLLASAGHLLGIVRRPRLFVPLTLWTAFMLWFFLRFEYQPVRNLYPLAPVFAFAALTALHETGNILRERGRWGAYAWRGMYGVVVLAAVLMAWNTWLAQAAWTGTEDSRVLAIRWLRANARGGEVAVISEDLGFAPPVLREVSSRHELTFRTPPSFLRVREALDGADYAVIPVNPLRKSNVRSAYPEAGIQDLHDSLWGLGFRRVLSLGSLQHTLLGASSFRYPLAPMDVYWRCLVRQDGFEGGQAKDWRGGEVRAINDAAQAHSGHAAMAVRLRDGEGPLIWHAIERAPITEEAPQRPPLALPAYEVRLFARCVCDGQRADVTVESRAFSGRVIGTKRALVTDAWSEMRCRFHTQDDPKTIEVVISWDSEDPSQEIAFDDVEIVRVPPHCFSGPITNAADSAGSRLSCMP